ncbi:MAG: hypothetical protein U9Q04_03600 [Campylobacterota bacterium]|nr:hypothetical protein [Campylobacterota bacterium]
MFKNNNKQFVNVLKRDDQIKIDYRVINNNKISKQENSTFLIKNNMLPEDAIFKLQTLQNESFPTYISSLYIKSSQTIKDNDKIDSTQEKSVQLDDKKSIVIKSSEIEEDKKYFEATGIDYMVSPYTLLFNAIKDNKIENSMNILVYDNKLYIMILDNKKEISYFEILSLTPFANIKESNFYNDDIIGQKLYDEIHFLELQQCLNDTIKKYYESNDEVEFLEKINIFYSIKQLSDDQLELLYETLMVNISYDQLMIDNILYSILEDNDPLKYSFITPGIKKSDNKILKWMILLLVSILALGGVVYFKYMQQEEQPVISKIEPLKKSEKVSKKVIKQEILPNHIKLNNEIVQHSLMLFDIVPFDALLQELEIKKDSSTFVANFIANSEGSIKMQDNLLRIYKESKVILEHKNKAVVSKIISNKSLIKEEDKKNDFLKYNKMQFKTKNKVQLIIENMTIKGTTVKFVSQKGKENLAFTYSLKSLVKDPKEFFAFVEKLNKQDHSIHLTYPIIFAKTKEGIVVEYELVFNQKIESAVK